MDELMRGEFECMVPRDGADDTPVKEFERFNAGQLLARILDGSAEDRLALCTTLLVDVDTATACRMHDHVDEIQFLRQTQAHLALERQQMYQLITRLSLYKAMADSIVEYDEQIDNGDLDDEYTRANLAEKISGWADMAKTTQAHTQGERQATTDDRDRLDTRWDVPTDAPDKN